MPANGLEFRLVRSVVLGHPEIVSSLPWPDSLHLEAAEGWLLLGNAKEAWADFQRIGNQSRRHPDALETEWSILAAQGNWQECAINADILIEVADDHVSGWINRAYAVRRMHPDGIHKALELLLPAVDRFPNEPIVPYNLACYACQLERIDEALQWLERALKRVTDKRGKQGLLEMAAHDEDLEPLQEKIQNRLKSLRSGESGTARNPGL